MKNVAWTPIGTTKTFMGTFDGGNKTISNLTVKVTDDENSAGLFGNVIGNIKNVKLSNVNISGHYKAGAVVGSIYGNIENCHVDGGKILSTARKIMLITLVVSLDMFLRIAKRAILLQTVL